MPAPKEVIKLIENFERNLDAYRSGKYNDQLKGPGSTYFC